MALVKTLTIDSDTRGVIYITHPLSGDTIKIDIWKRRGANKVCFALSDSDGLEKNARKFDFKIHEVQNERPVN